MSAQPSDASVPSAGPRLVFLDPPHDGAPDTSAVASALGVQLADARMRVGLPIPAPVAIANDEAAATRLSAALRAAGVRVALPGANELLAQPAEEDVTAFALDERAFAFRSSQGDGQFDWPDLRAAFLVTQSSFAVRQNRVEQAAMQEARAQIDAGYRSLALGNRYAARRAGRAALTLLDSATGTLTEATRLTLHLVAHLDGGAARAHLVLTQGSLRYDGLGPHRGSSGQQSWDALLSRVRVCAPHVVLDRRAERAAPRFPPLPGIAPLFGGKPPSAGWLHGAYLSWRASR